MGPSAAARQARGPSAAARLTISLPLNPMLGSNSRYHAKMYNHSESCCCVFKTETVEIS